MRRWKRRPRSSATSRRRWAEGRVFGRASGGGGLCPGCSIALGMHPDGSTRRGRGSGARAISGAARSAGRGAGMQAQHCMLQHLTCRSCLSGAVRRSAQRVLRHRPAAEHHSEVGATRRPPQHEPTLRSPGHGARPQSRDGSQNRKSNVRGPPPTVTVWLLLVPSMLACTVYLPSGRSIRHTGPPARSRAEAAPWICTSTLAR